MGNNCKGICYSNDSATKSLTDNMDNIKKNEVNQSLAKVVENKSSGNNFSKNFDENKDIKIDENGVINSTLFQLTKIWKKSKKRFF